MNVPGVFLHETSGLPPSVEEVASAVPAFIGYTSTAAKDGEGLTNKPTRITSLMEYEQWFGGDCTPLITGTIDRGKNNTLAGLKLSRYYLYESLRLFFDNGGGPCYIVSVGGYSAPPRFDHSEFQSGLAALDSVDEPTIVVMPDAAALDTAQLHPLQQNLIDRCGRLGDRVAVLDLPNAPAASAADVFRHGIGSTNLKYGAAYAPWILSAYPKTLPFEVLQNLAVRNPDGSKGSLADLSADAEYKRLVDLLETMGPDDATRAQLQDTLYSQHPAIGDVVRQIANAWSQMPPSGAVAGVYVQVDLSRGVWKAPASVSMAAVSGPVENIDNRAQEALNIDVSGGKSINAIRSFAGRGTLIWGARTLAGNDNEWRYVNVRRFFNMVEKSVKKSTEWAVFEPNDATLWAKLRNMIENYLIQKWRDGALLGTRAEEAFFVKAGLGQTMTSQDILDGRLIVEIGMAPIRPAEFIILRFSHVMQKP